MNVILRGVRGGISAPAPETAFYGGNTSCVEIRADNGIILFLDAGTGLREAEKELPESGEIHICITHGHMDHIVGLWFFKPIHSSLWTTHLYLPDWMEPTLDWYHHFGLFPVSFAQLKGKVFRHSVRAGEAFFLGNEDDASRVCVEPFATHHPGGCLGYRVKADGAVCVYTGDHEITANPKDIEEAAKMLAGADLAIVDAQYSREDYQPGFGHSKWEDWLEVMVRTDVKQLALSHHHPDRSDLTLHNLARHLQTTEGSSYQALVAREGMRFVPGKVFHPEQRQRPASPVQFSRRCSDRVMYFMGELSAYRETSAVLDRVLAKAREITSADAGTIFLAEGDELVFAYTHNDSLFSTDEAHKYAYSTIRIPISEESIAGYVAATGAILNLADVRSLPADAPYAFNDAFDRKTGFFTKSMLTMPFLDGRGKPLGVLQLINSLHPTTKVICAFTKDMEDECRMLGREVAAILEHREIEKRGIYGLLRMAAVHDPTETAPHAERVGAIAAELYHVWALRRGHDIDFIRHEKGLLRLAAMLHDIGKVGIGENVLKKPGKLTDEEFAIMRGHTAFGESILAQDPGEIATLARDIALHHHQKWNGHGYAGSGEEGKLAGENIPLSARVTAIADVFDALVSPRCYKQPWTFDDAMNLLRKEAGAHFDPELVACMTGIEELLHDIYAAFPD